MANHRKVSDEQIIQAAGAHRSMRAAAESIGVNLNTFKVRAQKLGVYKTNQGLKGVRTEEQLTSAANRRKPLEELESNAVLKARLLADGTLKNECSECGQDGVWNGKPLVMQMDHINGNNRDNRPDNLRMLCPNCHTQTNTFAGRNKFYASVV
jgi:5-methylcytosine-specific restriction endonuclease McrA